MILIQISDKVLVNPESIQFVERVVTDRGTKLMVNISDRQFIVEIADADFFNAINSTDSMRFEQFTRG